MLPHLNDAFTPANGLAAGWWPWLAIVGLGLFHGINPAMGWLFAVGLGLQRGRREVVLQALLPIALGHALAVALALGLGLSVGALLPTAMLARVGGALLMGWGLWHAWRGHRHRVRVGMRTGMAGLALWSFLMAGVHGAGVMLFPMLLTLCAPTSEGVGGMLSSGAASPWLVAGLALGLHSVAMLLTILVVAVLVYDRVGVGFLRTGWVNLDRLWSAALVVCGAALLAG